jgi:palmitoyltransferase
MASTVGDSSKKQARGDPSPLEQKLGQATSVIMPLLEFGAIGFWTWVFCYLICVQYLIRPSDDLQRSYHVRPRQSTGIALIVLYAILLLLLLVPWMRLIQVIWSKPDILPHGGSSVEKKDADASHIEQYDVYVCDYDGAPLYCEKCNIYKPDRTHHCKELGRCVRKMDHYCPWAGGIIAETSHKFFMQALFGGALYTIYLWLVVAIFLADRISKVTAGSRPPNDCLY